MLLGGSQGGFQDPHTSDAWGPEGLAYAGTGNSVEAAAHTASWGLPQRAERHSNWGRVLALDTVHMALLRMACQGASQASRARLDREGEV